MPNNTTLLAAAAAITTIALVIRRRQKPQDDRHARDMFIGSCSRAARVLEKPQPWRDYQDSSRSGASASTRCPRWPLCYLRTAAFSDLDKGALAMQQAVLKGRRRSKMALESRQLRERRRCFMRSGALDGKAYISDDLWREVAYNTPSHSINERLLCERTRGVASCDEAAGPNGFIPWRIT